MINIIHQVLARHKELRLLTGVPSNTAKVLIKTFAITAWWCAIWYRDERHWDFVKRWLSILCGWIKHRGLKWTVSHVKQLRNLVTKWFAGEMVPPGTYSVRQNADCFLVVFLL